MRGFQEFDDIANTPEGLMECLVKVYFTTEFKEMHQGVGDVLNKFFIKCKTCGGRGVQLLSGGSEYFDRDMVIDSDEDVFEDCPDCDGKTFNFPWEILANR